MTEATIQIDDLQPAIPNKTVKIVRISGQLDESNVDEKMQEVYQVVESTPSKLNLIFNLEGLDYMNSKSIGYITDIYGKITENGGQIAITSAKANILDILQVVGLTQLIQTFDTTQEAVLVMGQNAETDISQTETTPAATQTQVTTEIPQEITPTIADMNQENISQEVPQTPIEPQVQAAPETPQAPTEPQAQAAPEIPQTPIEPQVQTVPEIPQAPIQQQVQAIPEAPQTPAEPQAQAAPEIPQTPIEPQVQTVPEAPQAPAEQQVQTVPEAPQAPAEQQVQATPEVSQNPTHQEFPTESPVIQKIIPTINTQETIQTSPEIPQTQENQQTFTVPQDNTQTQAATPSTTSIPETPQTENPASQTDSFNLPNQ